MRGAWIEIVRGSFLYLPLTLSLPVRGAWIEIKGENTADYMRIRSLPVRGAWIEISSDEREALLAIVAPRAGSVD